MLSLLAIAGCAPTLVKTVDYEREVRDAMLVPGPTAPNAVGPLAPLGDLAIDAQFSVGAREAVTATREEGAPGLWVSRDAGSVHVATRATRWLELGVSFELRSSAKAEPLAVDLPALDTDPLLATFGTQVRAAPELVPDVRAGFLVEFDLTSTWYERSTVLTTTTNIYSPDELVPERTVETDAEVERGTALLPTARAGALLLWTPDPVHFGLGVSVRAFPVPYGYARQEWGCRYYEGGSGSCEVAPEMPPYTVARHSTDVWLETGVRLDRVWLLWTGWATVAGNETRTPAGATVAIRYWPGIWR